MTKESKFEINEEKLNIRDVEGKVGQAVNRNLKNDSSLIFFTSSLPTIRWAMHPLQQVPLNLISKWCYDVDEREKKYPMMPKESKFEMSEKKFQFDCDLCNVKSTSQVDLDIHRAGEKHKRKLQMSQDFDSLLKEDKLNEKFEMSEKKFPFGCELCNVKSTCQMSLDIHRAGRKHKRKLEMSQKLSPFGYDLCNVKSTCQMSLNIHKAGKTHQKKLEMSQTLSEFYCNLCNVKSTCQMSLDIHKAGKTHLRNLQYGFALS